MFKFTSSQEYYPVPEMEDSENVISSSGSHEKHHEQSKCSFSPFVMTAILLSTFTITLLSGLWIGRHFPGNLGNTCTSHVSKYSPLLEDIEVSYDTVQFNGSFTHENIYRQNGSQEVDAAWDALGGSFRPFIVPEPLAAKSGLTKNHVQRSSKYGGGYPVFLEGMHQLHCLDLLRKSLYFNYDHYSSLGKGAFGDPKNGLRWHVTHCLDFLRQRLMCTIDIGVLGAVWVKGHDEDGYPLTFPDFNTEHVCKNYDDIRAWAEQHQMPAEEETPEDYLNLPGKGVRVLDNIP